MKHQEFAQALSDALIADTRSDETTFLRLADGSPEWMTNLVRAAHDEMMPDDTKYLMIREVAAKLAENEFKHWDDRRCELCEGLVDVWNHSRVKWLATSLSRGWYCDEAIEEGLEPSGVYELIGMGQYREYDEIFGILAYGINELVEEDSDV